MHDLLSYTAVFPAFFFLWCLVNFYADLVFFDYLQDRSIPLWLVILLGAFVVSAIAAFIYAMYHTLLGGSL